MATNMRANHRISVRLAAAATFGLALATGCVSPRDRTAAGTEPDAGLAPVVDATPAASLPAPRPSAMALPGPISVQPLLPRPDPVLSARITALGAGFEGNVGIAVRDLQTGAIASWNGSDLFPQQSVSKLWVGIAVMDAVDRGRLRLSDPITVTADDMTLFHQPIRAELRGGAYRTTIGELLYRAMTQSDNTCNDVLLNRVGGPAAVRAVLARANVQNVRFGPGERLLQAGTAGLAWKPQYSVGNAFYAARGALAPVVRQAAMARYLADPIDGASPEGIAEGLAKLHRGEIISPASARRLIEIMYASRTGPGRMKAGSAPGWRIAHKTGTGQILNGVQAGYNDVGLVTAPDGSAYAVAILIGRTSVGIPERQRLMANVTRAVVDLKARSGAGAYGSR